MQTGKTMEINKLIIGVMREMIMEIKMSGIKMSGIKMSGIERKNYQM
jgi:hypothetical protein